MKVCPNCGYHDPPYWRVCRWDNPDGELEVCRIDDLQFNNPELAEKIENNRGVIVTDNTFAYLLGKKAVYVKRVAKHFYNSVGIPVAAGVLYPLTGWLLSFVFSIDIPIQSNFILLPQSYQAFAL